ncbi:MAG: glycosyltransferase family A protein [Candidatus Bathyarchaeia archaeon]
MTDPGQDGLVSIIMVTRNRPESLKRNLETIFRQSYNNFEIIVVDDGSEQDSLSAKNFPNTKYIHQEHMGANMARNHGFTHSCGEFLFFCDDDVRLVNNFLEKMVQALRTNPDKAYAYCGFEIDGKIAGMEPFNSEKLRKNNYISGISLIRRSRFPGFDPTIKRLQDWDLWLTMLESGFEGILVPNVLFSTTRENKPNISDDSNPNGWTYQHAYLAVSRKHEKTNAAEGLWTIAGIYDLRSDLQKTFPEAKRGDYTRIIDWAYNVVIGKIFDDSKKDLTKHEDYFKKVHANNQRTRHETD